MKTQNPIEHLDKILALLGVIFSIPLIVYLSLTSRSYLGSVHITSVILALFSCIIWLAIRKKASLEVSQTLYNHSFYLALSIFFFLCLICSILLVYFRPYIYVRPIEYFILVSVMAGTVSSEIFFTLSNKKYIYLILLQILTIGLNLVFSQMFIFPNVVGTDPWFHQMFTLKILNLYHIPEGFVYSKLPIFHLAVASSSIITELDYKFSAALSVCFLTFLAGALLLFLFGRYLFNERVGLLSALLFVTANWSINAGIELIPNTLGNIIVIIIIYMLFKLKAEKTYVINILSIIFLLILILTHTIAALSMAIILCISWVLSNIYKKLYIMYIKLPIYSNTVVFFPVTMLAWWTYATGHLITLAQLIKWGFSIDKHLVQFTATVPFLEKLLNYLGMILFFALSFIGCFYMISRGHKNFHAFVIATNGLIFMSLGFFPYISGHTILEYRWWILAQILLSLPLAVSFFIIYNSFRKNILGIISINFMITILSFLMMISPSANIDNHTFSPNIGERLAFTESEITAAAFFAHNSEGKISSDFLYAKCDSSSVFANYYNVSYDRIESIDKSLRSKNFVRDGCIKILRNEYFDGPVRLVDGICYLQYDPNEILSALRYDKIYDSSSVTAYL